MEMVLTWTGVCPSISFRRCSLTGCPSTTSFKRIFRTSACLPAGQSQPEAADCYEGLISEIIAFKPACEAGVAQQHPLEMLSTWSPCPERPLGWYHVHGRITSASKPHLFAQGVEYDAVNSGINRKHAQFMQTLTRVISDSCCIIHGHQRKAKSDSKERACKPKLKTHSSCDRLRT